MAWYKCSGGGEGIPLITKSGSIVTYEDNVGGVPVNDLVADITPIQASGTPSPSNPLPISGYTSGKITVCGKNLLNSSLIEQDGNNRVILADNLYLKATTYNLSLETSKIANFYYRKHGEAKWINVGGYNKTNISITIDSEDYYDISYYISTGILVSDLSSIQLEVGNTKTDYTNFVTPTTATVQFGQTVYGGTWKAKEGKVVDVPIKVKFSDIPQANWRYSNNNGNWNSYLFFTELPMRARATTGLSNIYDYQPNTVEANVSNNSYILPSWNTYVYIRDDAITSVADFLQAHGDDYIIMKPVTPTEITVEPVLMETIEGENNVFANTGNLTAKFYKSSVSNLDTLVEQTKNLAPDIIALASAGDGSTTRVGFDLTEDTTWTKSTRIQNYLFYKNINVENINLPSILEVGEYAFEDAKYIKGINLPNCITLKREAFYNACQKHTASTLPSVTINLPSVTVINDRALGQVGYSGGLPATLILTSCQEIKANGARGTGSAYMRINELLLPALVSIGGDAMDYHVFGTVDIGQNCTSIGNKPFNYCTIDTLIVRATTPPSLNSGGLGCTPTRIKVPSASVETYKTASWSTYASIIEAIPT